MNANAVFRYWSDATLLDTNGDGTANIPLPTEKGGKNIISYLASGAIAGAASSMKYDRPF
jgi:hypothetical protein